MARSRSLNSALTRLLAGSSMPIYVLDSQRTIIYANTAFFDWTGTDDETLIGVRCDYHSAPEVGPHSEAAAMLCPPAEVFRGECAVSEVACRNGSGKVQRRRAQFISLGGDEIEHGAVLAVLDPENLVSSHPPKGGTNNSSPSHLHQRLLELRQQTVPRFGIDRLVGDSPTIKRIREQVRFAHQSRVRSIIYGPPGSGREHIARTIHYGDNPRGASRLIPIACSLMDAELLQATITNVVRNPSEDEDTIPPTLLLLDVDQLPDTAQYELSGYFTIPDFQLYTLGTSRSDLLKLAEAGEFRKDLAAALSTLVIHLPPLVERSEDVTALAQVFLEQFNSTGGHQLSGFAPDALDRLAGYHWPKNVDELAEIVHESCAHAESTLVSAWDLPQRIRYAADAAAYPRPTDEEIVLDDFLAEIEKELIQRALQRAKGNKTKAAQLLGMTRPRLHRRLEQLDLNNAEQDESES